MRIAYTGWDCKNFSWLFCRPYSRKARACFLLPGRGIYVTVEKAGRWQITLPLPPPLLRVDPFGSSYTYLILHITSIFSDVCRYIYPIHRVQIVIEEMRLISHSQSYIQHSHWYMTDYSINIKTTYKIYVATRFVHSACITSRINCKMPYPFNPPFLYLRNY